MAMSMFDDREKGYEGKWKRDEELRFKVTARRNKLLGLWAAQKFGMEGGDADAYAKSVVVADFDRPGDDDVVEKVLADFAKYDLEMTDHGLRKEMARLMDEASRQIEAQAAEG